MTETEWLGCTDPETMLGFIQGRVSERRGQRVLPSAFFR